MKNNKIIVFLLLLFVLAAPRLRAQEASSDTLMKFVRNLASSRYEGRQAGSDGLMKASQYVIDVLESYGFKPYEDNWIQYYADVECNKVESASLSTYFNANDAHTDYVLGRDFACASMTGRGYVDAPVVFCGWGIDNAIYDDYSRIDAKGKVVLVLTGTPDFLPQSIANQYATLRDKARVARAHGAVALVAINMSPRCRPTEVQCPVFAGDPPHMPTFPILQTTRWSGGKLLADERITLDSLLTLFSGDQKPHSFLLDKKFQINVNAVYNPKAKVGNIVGYFPSQDKRLRREYLVVGASLDHVGQQGETCFFPGADNATGTAVLMEVARMLSQSDAIIGRNIIFVVTQSGEHNYQGSELFLQTFNKLEWLDAFINVDCVGSGDSIALLGAKRFPIINSIALKNDSLYTQYAKQGLVAMPMGDARLFTQIGIPSLSICTTNGHRYDHVPSDIPENIDRRMVSRVATLLYHTLVELSNGDYQGRSEKSREIKFNPILETVNPYSDGNSVDGLN